MAESRCLRPATAPTSVIRTAKICDLCGWEIDAHDACSHDCSNDLDEIRFRPYRIARYKITTEFLGEEYPARDALLEELAAALDPDRIVTPHKAGEKEGKRV